MSEPTILTPVQETSLAAPITILPLLSISTTPHAPQQTTTLISLPPITIDAPIITFVVPESNELSAVQLRVAKLEKDVSELKNINHSAATIATLKSQVPTVVDDYLGSKLGDAFQKALQKHSEDLIQKHSMKLAPESRKIKTPTVNLEKGSKKSASEILKIKRDKLRSKRRQSLQSSPQTRNPANHKLYHALMEALIEDENAIDKGVVDTVKDHKRKHDDEDPPAEPNQGKKTKWRRTKESESSKKPSTTKETPKGKSPSKCSKTGKSASAKKLVEEPTTEVVMDDTGKDVVCNDDQPQDISEPMTTKTLNPEWFTQPPRPPTPDPE
ncbi:hypothetical protein Tco_1064963 [Tanacetum coccineum]